MPQKGGIGKYGTHKCLEFIEDNGDKERDIIVKNDQEPSMQYLIRDIVSERSEGRTVLKESPKYSSGSNGVAERGVQEIEGKIRALYIGLEERLGLDIDACERIMAFAPDYAAYLLNRLN